MPSISGARIVQFEPPFVVVALAHREIEGCCSTCDLHELFGGIHDGEIDRLRRDELATLCDARVGQRI